MIDPIHHKSLQRRLATFLTLGLLLMAAAMILDRFALAFLALPTARLHDWHRSLRVMGYLPIWLIVSLAFLLVDHPSNHPAVQPKWWPARGLSLALAATLGGVGAETLKLILRRERPDNSGDFSGYLFRSFTDGPFRSVNLGLPSSHAMVAFAAAFALSRLLPQARPIWLSLALGCGLTRLLDHAHYPSDIALAALGGYAAAWTVAALIPLNHAPPATPGARGTQP